MTASGRATKTSTSASAVPERDVEQVGREHEQAEREDIVSWASHARPSWNAATVWRAGSVVDPIARPAR